MSDDLRRCGNCKHICIEYGWDDTCGLFAKKGTVATAKACRFWEKGDADDTNALEDMLATIREHSGLLPGGVHFTQVGALRYPEMRYRAWLNALSDAGIIDVISGDSNIAVDENGLRQGNWTWKFVDGVPEAEVKHE